MLGVLYDASTLLNEQVLKLLILGIKADPSAFILDYALGALATSRISYRINKI